MPALDDTSATSADVRSQSANPPRLIPLTAWPDHHPWPPIGGLRHLVFNADSNGFATAFVRVGTRVLVDEAAFFRAVEAKNRANKAPKALTPRRRGRRRDQGSRGEGA
jgi:hypothetical protein